MMQLEDLQTSGIFRNNLAGRALTEIKISLFCKLTERCTTSCGSTKCASVHIPSNGDKRGSTPAHLFSSCVVDQRISMSVNSTTVFLRRTHTKRLRLSVWCCTFRALGNSSSLHTHTSSATELLVKTAAFFIKTNYHSC